MDALLSGKRALPGSVMADRFALLADNPNERRDRVSAYLDFYGARSSVAHGGQSRRIADEDFMKAYFEAVRWCAWRTIDLGEQFNPSSEKDIDAIYDDLRWSVKSWNKGTTTMPSPGGQVSETARPCGSALFEQ